MIRRPRTIKEALNKVPKPSVNNYSYLDDMRVVNRYDTIDEVRKSKGKPPISSK